MDKPIFSIITPSNNRPNLLKRCIESVLSQSFGNFEQIIVDDANDTKSADLVAGIDDKRLRYIAHKKQSGAGAAYNTGIKMAIGSFICFLDDDDEYLPGILEKIHQLFKDSGNNLGFVWTGIRRVQDTENGEQLLLNTTWPQKFSTMEQGLLAATGIGNGFGVCVRKSCIDEIGLYDETLKVGQDTDFMIRLAKKYNFQTVPEILVKIHIHVGAQLTSVKNNSVRKECYERIIERHFEFLSKYWKVIYAHNLAFANLSYSEKKKKKSRKIFWALIRKFPFKWIQYADFFCFELFGTDYHSWDKRRKQKK